MSARAAVKHRHHTHLLLPRLVGLLALFLAATACGSGDNVDDGAEAGSTTMQTLREAVFNPLGTSPTTAPSPISTGQRWTYTSTTASGDVTGIELQISKPYPVSAAPRAGSHSFSEVSCPADPQRDAVMVGSLKGTNQTSGSFSQVIDVQIYAGTVKGTTGTVFDAALLYSSSSSCASVGACCYSTSDPIGVKSNNPLPPGQSVSVDFYIILHDVFTPAKPNGVYPVNGVYLLPYGGTVSNISGPSKPDAANAPNSSVGFPLDVVLD